MQLWCVVCHRRWLFDPPATQKLRYGGEGQGVGRANSVSRIPFPASTLAHKSLYVEPRAKNTVEDNMELGLAGKVAIVTGGSKGIGRATALKLIAEGGSVTVCARGQEALAETVAAAGDNRRRRYQCRRQSLHQVGRAGGREVRRARRRNQPRTDSHRASAQAARCDGAWHRFRIAGRGVSQDDAAGPRRQTGRGRRPRAVPRIRARKLYPRHQRHDRRRLAQGPDGISCGVSISAWGESLAALLLEPLGGARQRRVSRSDLDQHAVAGSRRDERLVGVGELPFIHDIHALLLEMGNLLPRVGDLEGQVMDPLAVPFQKRMKERLLAERL